MQTRCAVQTFHARNPIFWKQHLSNPLNIQDFRTWKKVKCVLNVRDLCVQCKVWNQEKSHLPMDLHHHLRSCSLRRRAPKWSTRLTWEAQHSMSRSQSWTSTKNCTWVIHKIQYIQCYLPIHTIFQVIKRFSGLHSLPLSHNTWQRPSAVAGGTKWSRQVRVTRHPLFHNALSSFLRILKSTSRVRQGMTSNKWRAGTTANCHVLDPALDLIGADGPSQIPKAGVSIASKKGATCRSLPT